MCIFVKEIITKNKLIMKVTANNTARTFTLRNQTAKYRTIKMSKQEFESAKYWTSNDWNQFLKTDEYYKVK